MAKARKPAKPRRRLVIDVKPSGDREFRWTAEWRGFGRHHTVRTKREAVTFAVHQAMEHENNGGIAQVMIWLRGGDFDEERTFGADPRDREG